MKYSQYYLEQVEDYGIIQYSKKYEDIKANSVIYTSGSGGLFKAGIPIGKIRMNNLNEEKKVEFFSDFSQLKFVKVFSFKKVRQMTVSLKIKILLEKYYQNTNNFTFYICFK